MLAGKVSSIEEGKDRLRDCLNSGAGMGKLKEFSAFQGGDTGFIDDPSLLSGAPVKREIVATNEGWLAGITAETVGYASVEIGAGRKKKSDKIDHSVGFVFHVKTGDKVTPGTPLVTIHAASEASAEMITPVLRSAFIISRERVERPPVVIDVVS